jgi:hypothetical protein
VPDRAPDAPPAWSPLRRLTDFFRRHPIAFLLVLTPGIPEYLSGSSTLTGLLWNPFEVFAFLVLNLAMYGPGALLIREAVVRWRAGWGAVAVLSVGYAVMEEGIADATFFNPHDPNVGVLGSYGHFLGTNWVWVPGVVMVHMVFSISIPLFLFGLAFPGLRGRSLLTGRQATLLFAILSADTSVIAAIGFGYLHWFDGPVVVAICVAIIGLTVLLGRRLPPGWPTPPTELPRLSPRQLFLLGLALFPTVLVLTPILGVLGTPAAVTFVALLVLLAGFAFALNRCVGRSRHLRHLLCFSAGAIVPIAVVGALGGFPVPLVLVADALAYLFFRRMWVRCVASDAEDGPAPNRVPAGALAGAG